MDGSGAPNLTLVPVTTAEVFEATNVLLAKKGAYEGAPEHHAAMHALERAPQRDAERRVRSGLAVDRKPLRAGQDRCQGRVRWSRRGPILFRVYASEAPRAARSMDRSNRYSQIAKLALTDS